VRRVQFADHVVEYGSMAEIVRAIVDLEAEIAALASTPPPSFTLAMHSRD
jgi:hypothetical protein